MRNQSIPEESVEPFFTTLTLGLKEHTVINDLSAFTATEILRPPPLPRLLVLLTNHQIIYIFNKDFGVGQKEGAEVSSLMQNCRLKVDLRMTYKFQSLLHLKIGYSTNLQCLFLMLQGGELAVFNEEIYLLNVLKLDCCDQANSLRYCLDYEYIEKEGWREARKIKKGFFVFLFGDSIEWHEVEIDTNHKLSKFKPSYRLSITQLKKRVLNDQLEHPLGLQVFNYRTKHSLTTEKTSDYIYLVCNCSSDIFFALISKTTMEVQECLHLRKVVTGTIRIVSVQIGVANQRAILGMSNGVVKVYSLKVQTRGKVLFTIDIGQAAIQSMLWLKESQMLLTYCQDGYVSQINFHTMVVQQNFRAGTYCCSAFINDRCFLGLGCRSNSIYNSPQNNPAFSKQLIFNQLNLSYQKIAELNSGIGEGSKLGSTHLLQLNDNSLVILKEGEHSIDSIRTYLPPKCVSVRSISRNPIATGEQYWLLTDRSQVYMYQLDGKSVKVKGVIELIKFKDRQGSEYRYSISCLSFARKVVPIEFDSELTDKQSQPKLQTFLELQPVILGTTSGELLIVSQTNLFQIVFRLKIFDAPVKYILQILPYFDSDSNRSVIVFGTVQKGVLTEVTTRRLPRELFRLELSEERIKQIHDSFLVLLSGSHFNVFYFKEELGYQECQCYRQEHYSPGVAGDAVVTAVSHHSENDCEYLSVGYSLGQIMVWKLEGTVPRNGFLSLSPAFVINNSKQEPIQHLFTRSNSVCFNLGLFFVKKQIVQQDSLQSEGKNLLNLNVKIQKGKALLWEQFKGAQNIQLKKERKRKKGEQLPFLKVGRKRRSDSVGVIGSGKMSLPQVFHFPDTQLYRSLISKRAIH